MQVLIIKTSSMGDILHTLPALTDATRALPNIIFDWVVEEHFSQIPHWHPSVRQVIPVAIRRWRKNWFNPAVRKERYDFKYHLQQHHYDAVIDAQGLMKSAALVTRMARGEKHGLNYKSTREIFSSFFYNQRYDIVKKQHAIERIRQLFSAILGYPCPSNPGDYAISEYFHRPQTRKVSSYLIFLHSSTHVGKHWPEPYWRTLIRHTKNVGYKIKLPWGSEYERLRAHRLANGFQWAEVLPHLTLMQVAEQLVGATAVISVDTGLSHLAAALGCVNLTLYGPTDPVLVGVYGKNQHVIRSKMKTMKSLTAEHVWRRFEPLLLPHPHP